MERASSFGAEEDREAKFAVEKLVSGEAGSWASWSFAWPCRASRPGSDRSKKHPARIRTNSAPGSRNWRPPAFLCLLVAVLLSPLFPALFPDQRPFPITHILRSKPDFLERVITATSQYLPGAGETARR